MRTMSEPSMTAAARESSPRRIGTAALVGIALLTATAAIHITELSSEVDEVAYLGFGYLALSCACVVAISLLTIGDRRGWVLGLVACAATLVAFVLTRTTGLPAATDDIGNWSETIAVWSLIVEGAFCLLAVATLIGRRSTSSTAPAPGSR
jgi:hypothetical protein